MNTVEKWLENDNKLGIDIWNNKYRFNGESFDEWLDRVSNGSVELRNMIKNKDFLFAGRTLANYNTNNPNTTSNCFVVGYVPDSISGMMDMIKDMAITYKSGGGCGINLSKIRPKNSIVTAQNGYTSDGFSGFLELFDQLTKTISQGSRRGALLGMMDVNHPDIMDFINIKKNPDSAITSANLSVVVDDKFMKAVKNKEVYESVFLVEDTGEEIIHTVDAPKIYRKIMENAHSSAEPGILFWDNMHKTHMLGNYEYYEIVGNNPCSEFFGDKDSACNLGSINLSNFIKDNTFDFDRFKKVVRIAVRSLDDVLEYGAKRMPTNSQKNNVLDKRNIGLGIMGLADLFIKLKIKYGSEESKEISSEISKVMLESAVLASLELAKEKGACPFLEDVHAKEYISDKLYKKGMQIKVCNDIVKHGLRNISLLSIAPTGSLSTLLGISGGIEPIFRNYYVRTTKTLHEKDVSYKVYHKAVKDATINGIIPDYCIESNNINWKDRVDVQSSWQNNVDLAISSTVNLPKETTVEEIMDIYIYAWEQGLNGITIYRDGSLEGILNEVKDEETIEEVLELTRGEVKDIADDTIYYPKKIITGCGSVKLFIGYSEKEKHIQDLYTVRAGNGGGCDKNITSTVIFMSQVLRLGGNVLDMQKAINGISACASYAKREGTSKGSSCASGIMYAILEFLEELECKVVKPLVQKTKKIEIAEEVNEVKDGIICPECGEKLNPIGGCWSCICGYSHCD